MLSDALPNVLIGLREGLEAGLVVGILLAAVHKSSLADGARRPSAPVWLGLIGAVSVSVSFAVVLSTAAGSLGRIGQDVVGGLLSILAVVVVTAMIFWMSRTAASLSGELSGKVHDALMLGAGALALTAFMAVAREGLETTLFFWTAARAAGESTGPVIGGAVGVMIAVVLCWLLYRRSVRMNLKTFFSRTAVLLIVIAAGILAYGIGDLQTVGWLPGRSWYAFDLSSLVSTDSWWVTLITGLTQLTPRMTVLQVLAWAGYLVVVVPAFVRASHAAPTPPASPQKLHPSALTQLVPHRLLAVSVAVVIVPALLAAVTIALLPEARPATSTLVTVTATSCAADWSATRSGNQTFTVANRSGKTGEINLVDANNGVVAEIETLGTATSAPMSATLGSGSYRFTCLLAGQPAMDSPVKQISGQDSSGVPVPIVRVSEDDLKPAMVAYQYYVDGLLAALGGQVHRVRTDLGSGHIDGAKADWTSAMLTWTRVGAAYGSFGDYADAIAGLPHGLPGGVTDPDFTGLRRLEYGLWHDQPPAQLIPATDALADEVAKLRANLSDAMPEAPDQTKRPHEILEDTLRFQLAGYTNQGAGTEYAETAASIDATRAVLGQFAALISPRAPTLIRRADAQLDAADAALHATQSDGHWVPLTQVPVTQRRAVNAALGQALETLAAVPLVIELPISR